MVESQSSKLITRVRFPSSAPLLIARIISLFSAISPHPSCVCNILAYQRA